MYSSPVGLCLQGGWPCPALTALLLACMACLVSSQLTPLKTTTAAFHRTTHLGTTYKPFIQTTFDRLTTYILPTQGIVTPYRETPQHSTPIPTVYTQIATVPTTQSTLVGNLTGPNICTRDVIETRYVWKQLTFDCVRKEYVFCGSCPGCSLFNATHCLKLINGKCQADVYQYEPVTVKIQECCSGYEVQGTSCVESVECQTNNGGCPHICRSNKEAGRHCECYTGFHLSGSACVDFNECERQMGGCSDDCENTVGSFYCKCRVGRHLVTPLTCEDLKPCEQQNGGCEHNCIPKDGTHYCTCNEGFQLIEGRDCRDIDECAKPNPCKHKCENRIGSYICRCPEGQFLLPDNTTCTGKEQAAASQQNILMIGTLAGVGALLFIVACVWIICCYMSGCYCYKEKEKRQKRRRRRKKRREDVEAIVVHYKNGDNKDDDPPGYSNPPPNYDTEYNTHARTPNGMAAKEEVSGDIHIIPDFNS